MQGKFVGQQVSSNPNWTSADEGRMIYNTDDGYYYYGSDLAWVKFAKSSDLDSHANSDGSSHGYIDQDVTSGSSPVLDAANFTGILSSGLNAGVGIADDNLVEIDDADIADDDYAKFTTNGLEGRSYSEVKTDLSLDNVENTAISTWAGSESITTLGTIGTGTWNGTSIEGAAVASTGEGGGSKFLREDGDGSCSWQTPEGEGDVSATNSPVDDDFAKFTDGTTIEGRSYAEVKSDLSLDNVTNEDATDPANWDPSNTDGNFLVGNGSTFVAESGATARTSLGLGTQATKDQYIDSSSQNSSDGDVTYVVD